MPSGSRLGGGGLFWGKGFFRLTYFRMRLWRFLRKNLSALLDNCTTKQFRRSLLILVNTVGPLIQ